MNLMFVTNFTLQFYNKFIWLQKNIFVQQLLTSKSALRRTKDCWRCITLLFVLQSTEQNEWFGKRENECNNINQSEIIKRDSQEVKQKHSRPLEINTATTAYCLDDSRAKLTASLPATTGSSLFNPLRIRKATIVAQILFSHKLPTDRARELLNPSKKKKDS